MPSQRSRSKTTEAATLKNNKELQDPSITLSATAAAISPTSTESDSETADRRTGDGTMATTTTTQRAYRPLIESNDAPTVETDADMDAEDSRSSSLSDVDDAQEDQLMTSPNISTEKLDDDLDDDSEAETERLEQITPKARRGTLSDGKFSTEKASSALSREVQIDSDIEEEPSPLSRSRDVAVEDELDALDALATIATGNTEPTQLKRKRSSSEGSELSDVMDMDEPARKRSHSEHAIEDDDDDDDLEDEMGEVVEDAVDDNVQPEDDEAELDTGKAPIEEEADEAVPEHIPTARGLKGRKGKRKGKKTKETDMDLGQMVEDALTVPDVEVDEAEGEVEEEDAGAADEELTKKKAALDQMQLLEKYFVPWRKAYIVSELTKVELEMKTLEGPLNACRHPEFLAQRTAIDRHRDKKMEYENTLRTYKREQEGVKLVAGRQQVGSQYFQSVRHLRDTSLEQCNKHFHALQRDRRRWGADERNHLRMFNPDRRQQIKDQTKYNKEVSILSGVAKYHGMPAAPPMSLLKKDAADDDFKAMGLNIQPVQQRVMPRQPTLAGPSTAAHEDRTEAAAQFYEQTPWANPLHPSHTQNPEASNFYNSGRAASATYATPSQHRIHSGPNGSASTIEAFSNPNSSASGQHTYNADNHQQPTSHPNNDGTPLFRRANSGAQSVPPPANVRRQMPPETSQTPVPQATRAFGLHHESAVNQPFPTSGLHAGVRLGV